MNTYLTYAEKQMEKLDQKGLKFRNRKEDEYTERDARHFITRLNAQYASLAIVRHSPDQDSILKAIKFAEEQQQFFFQKTRILDPECDAYAEAWRLFHFNSAHKDMLYMVLTAHDNRYEEEQERMRKEAEEKGQKKKK